MTLPKGMRIAVVDGSRGLVLVNEGSTVAPRLAVHRSYAIDNPPTHLQGEERPTRMQSADGTRRSGIERPDLHQRAEDQFVRAIVRDLETDAAAAAFERLVIVAPPVALGEMRKAIGPPLAGRIAKEIAADYIKMPLTDIARAVAAALAK